MTKQEIANRWVGEDCALNGNPARISGRLLPYGIIGMTHGRGYRESAEFCWQTVDRIMKTTKTFKT